MEDIFQILVVVVSFVTVFLSHHFYTRKSGVAKNIAVYILVGAITTAIAQLTNVLGVFPDGSILEEILEQSPVVTSFMFMLILLEIAKIKK